MLERVAVLIDGTNIAHGCRRNGVRLDYSLLLDWLSAGGGRNLIGAKEVGYRRVITLARVYLGPPGNNDDRARENFIRMVTAGGRFSVQICTEEGDSRKSAVDRDMTIDALLLAFYRRMDTCALFSGDGGFTRLVRILRALGVFVEVYAFASDTPQVLMEAADIFCDLSVSDIAMLRGNSGNEQNFV